MNRAPRMVAVRGLPAARQHRAAGDVRAIPRTRRRFGVSRNTIHAMSASIRPRGSEAGTDSNPRSGQSIHQQDGTEQPPATWRTGTTAIAGRIRGTAEAPVAQ